MKGICSQLQEMSGSDSEKNLKFQEAFANHPSSQFLTAFNQIAKLQGSRLFLVGGCVRNAILSIPFHEVDLLLHGNLYAFLESVSTNPDMTIVTLDKERNLFRLVPKPQKISFDLSPCEEKSVEENLLKRELPINAVAVDLEGVLTGSFHFLDPQNGIEDLQNKIIRTLSSDRLKEDPLRILRAFRFAALLNFSVEEKTEKIIKEMAPLLHSVSIERIRDELFKILSAPESYHWLCKMDSAGILDIVFPEILPMKKMNQNPRYHKYSVWIHSLETIHHLENLLLEKDYPEKNLILSGERTQESGLKFAALFHDLGKPSTFRTDEHGEIHFYQHEAVGEQLIKSLGKRFRLSVKEIQFFSLLIRNHLRPAQLARSPKTSKAAVTRLFREIHPYQKELIFLCLADTLAKGVQADETITYLENLLVKLEIGKKTS